LAVSENFGTSPGGKDDMFVFDVDVDNKIINQKRFSDCMIDGVKCGAVDVRCDVNGNVWPPAMPSAMRVIAA
jgi:gluconolactonase